MRVTLFIAMLSAFTASLSYANKCEEAKTFLATNKEAIDKITESKPEAKSEGKQHGRHHRGKARTGLLKRNVAALTKETEKTSGHSEKKCERLMKNIERRLAKAKTN